MVRHPDAEIILSQPGMGTILGARVLAEFGHAPGCYADAKARKNYAGTSPITRASGKRGSRFVHSDQLIDAVISQAQSALKASPGDYAAVTGRRTALPAQRAAQGPNQSNPYNRIGFDGSH